MRPVPSSFGLSSTALVAFAIIATACGDAIVTPDVSNEPAFAELDGGWSLVESCPAYHNVVVRDAAELVDALDAAEPHEVIAIDGVLEVEESVWIEQDRVVLTCATPYSGLAVAPGSGIFDLVQINASEVTLSHLVLDASEGGRAIRARNDGEELVAWAPTVRHNEVICGSQSCTLFQGVPQLHFHDNHVVATQPTASGVHVQGQGPFAPDGTRPREIDDSFIYGNTIVAETASTGQTFGGIRVRDGRNVWVLDNRVIGPWQNSMAVDDVRLSYVRGNVLEGALQYGILIGLSSPVIAGTRDSGFSRNAVSGALDIGIWMVSGCGNHVLDNHLVDNGTDGIDGIRFSDETGANTYAGDLGVVDAEAGAWDCDGDDIVDPNILIGG